MTRILVWAAACVIGLSAGAESAPRRKSAAPPAPERPATNQPIPQQDEFRSCDVAVRDFVQGRKEATALPVKEIKVDGLRMTLNFVHPYGESGDTPPNLAFTRGESVDERRKALNETKQRINTLAEAAKTGNVWYVISLVKENTDNSDGRRNHTSVQPEDNRPSASAVVLASIEDRCITVADFKQISLERLSDELRTLLGESGRGSPPVGSSATVPIEPRS